MAKFLRFEEEPNPTGVTKRWAVYADRDLTLLGHVRWYAPWRRYTYVSDDGPVIFDARCLREVVDFLDTQTSIQKTDAASRRADRE